MLGPGERVADEGMRSAYRFGFAMGLGATLPLYPHLVMAVLRDGSFRIALALSLVSCSSELTDEPSSLFAGYSDSNVTVPTRLPIESLVPLGADSTITAFSISPPLPAGLILDETTGVISGTPIGLAASETYTITAVSGSVTDVQEISIAVRPPIVGLSSDRALVIAASASGNPVAASGVGVAPTGGAPMPSVAAQVAVDQPSQSLSASLTIEDQSIVAGDAADAVLDAMSDFMANVVVDGEELASSDPWQFGAQAPYDDDGLTPGLGTFEFDTAEVVVEEGALMLEIELPSASLGPFSTEGIATEIRNVVPITDGVTAMVSDWFLVGGRHYGIMQIDGQTELYCFDIDGGAGGGASLSLVADVDDAVSGDAQIRAVVGGQIIVDMRDAGGVMRTHAYDPATDTLAQIAGLAGASPDVTSGFIDFDGVPYFVTEDETGLSGVYRYLSSSHTLERISDTAGGASENPIDLHAVNGFLYFLADDDQGDRHLYRFDPIFMTQERLSDDAIAPVGRMATTAERVLVTGRNEQGAEKLFAFDFCSGELRQVSNTSGDSGVDDQITFGKTIAGDHFFSADRAPGVRKLFRFSDSPEGGSVEQVSDTAGASSSDAPEGSLVQVGGQLFFSAQNSDLVSKLFALDLASGESRQVCNVNDDGLGDNPIGLLAVGSGQLAFSGTLQPSGNRELFVYDLEADEALRLADIDLAGSDGARPLAVVDGRLVFAATIASGETNAYTID